MASLDSVDPLYPDPSLSIPPPPSPLIVQPIVSAPHRSPATSTSAALPPVRPPRTASLSRCSSYSLVQEAATAEHRLRLARVTLHYQEVGNATSSVSTSATSRATDALVLADEFHPWPLPPLLSYKCGPSQRPRSTSKPTSVSS
ncbi:hypothetical protein ACP70R_048978 [Stipagrostis hirtigluma subsp. patula]